MIKRYIILTELKPPRKFSYKFILNKNINYEKRQEILTWLKENCGKYNQDYIYWALKKGNMWNGDSELYFKTEELAMAFKLRWL